MTVESIWLHDNWFSFLQSVGIAGSLVFTAISVRQNSKDRDTKDLLTLAALHRDLWGDLNRRPELQRIREREVDFVAKPMTSSEAEFLNLAIVHFYTGWLLAKRGAWPSLRALTPDVQGFFSLPIPKTVWQATRETRDPKFVKFVEKCCATNV
jgi:hypothetical protein